MLGNYTEIKSDTKSVTIDIETFDPYLKTSGVSWVKNEGYIVGISCKIDNEPSEYYPLKHGQGGNYDKDKVMGYFFDLFKQCYEKNIFIIGHYLYYDLGWLDYEGFMTLNYCPPLRDTLIRSQLYDNRLTFSLKFLAKYFKLGEKIEINDIGKIAQMPVSVVEKYACNDTDLTKKLDNFLLDKEIDTTASKRENALIPILVQMKKQGIGVNLERLEELNKELESKLFGVMKVLYEIDPKIKIWANTSIEFLFKKLNLSYPRTDLGNPSFTAQFLESVKHPIVESLAEARKLHRLINNFILGIKEKQINGTIHPDYFNGRSDDGGTVTGRLSSANPNIQQIPSRTEDGLSIRSIFIPTNGIAWSRFDYSQQEPRLALHYGSRLNLQGIEEWKQKYKENEDTDFYDALTEATGIKDRKVTKTNTLALMYGMGLKHMSEMLRVSEKQSSDWTIQFYRSVPWLSQLRNYIVEKIRKDGQIKTLGGRALKLGIKDSNKAFNYLIQGSAADQTKQAMINIYKETGKIPLNQVHDELGYDFNEEDIANNLQDKIIDIMKNAFPLDFPVKVDFSIGNNWKECCE